MRSILLTVLTVGMVGCIGQLDSPGSGSVGGGTNPPPSSGGGSGPSMGQTLFENDVYPIIKNPGQLSDCSSCHDSQAPAGNVTGFVSANKADAYATITSFQAVVGNFTPSTAEILTQVAANHSARVYTDDQKAKITAWLAQEVTDRANGGGGTGSGTSGGETPSAATSRVLNEWSACMNITDFNTANMAGAWGQMAAGNSACKDCHATGGYGMIVTGIAETPAAGGAPGLFTTIDTNKYYTIQYFTVDLSQGPAMAKVVINHTSFDGVSKGIAPHAEHPQFNSTNNGGMTALQKFYDLTMAKVTAGGCGPTKLNPPA
jgi:cytochrome c553